MKKKKKGDMGRRQLRWGGFVINLRVYKWQLDDGRAEEVDLERAAVDRGSALLLGINCGGFACSSPSAAPPTNDLHQRDGEKALDAFTGLVISSQK